tara:strand:- start:4427 stop:4975 length:549 start_codon:yes stop_codon:yes gene_type:complete
MVRVEDLNITFFHLPKNAGSSIATWLTMNACGEEYFDEFRHATPQGLEPLFDDFGWSFCCVRNPWDRYVSWYNFFRGQDKVHTCFNDWMTAVISGNHSAKYIKPMDNQLRMANHVDYVIKYENLEEDFKLIQQKTGCPKPLFKSNSSKRTAYIDYYANKDQIDWVADHHAEEIAQFNYIYGE